jgi:hypothetical protein
MFIPDESGEKKVVEEYSISRGSVRSGLPEDADLMSYY